MRDNRGFDLQKVSNTGWLKIGITVEYAHALLKWLELKLKCSIMCYVEEIIILKIG